MADADVSAAPHGAGVVRPYEEARDLEAVTRIWREVGWVSEDHEVPAVEVFHRAGRTLVYEQHGAAEASSHITRGRILYQDTDLPLAAVTAVTTSHVARRQGAARRLLAQMLAEEAADGMVVAALGIFDQGFYDQLGFGTLPYDVLFDIDPATLQVDRTPRPPVRISKDDWRDVHAALLARRRTHGSVLLDEPVIMQAELIWFENPIGLGYRDEQGRLTHFLFGEMKGEHGPIRTHWLCWQDRDQLLELLSLLRSLGDQVHTVRILQPPHVQLQDLLRQPFREGRRTGTDGHNKASAWRQLRILDLPASLAAATFPGEPVRFTLDLHDPVADHLPEGSGWAGVNGEFVVTVGPESSAEAGAAAELPTLRAGIGAFSRLLWGVQSASSLAITDDLEAPPELLAALDRTVRLPLPMLDWDF